MKFPVTQFLYFGEHHDYSAEGYEIDNFHRVFKNGTRVSSKGFAVHLTHADGSGKHFNAIRLFQAVVNPLPADIEKDAVIRTVNPGMYARDARRYEYETLGNLLARQETEKDEKDTWKTVRYDGGQVFDKYEMSKKTGVIREKLTKQIVVPVNGVVQLVR